MTLIMQAKITVATNQRSRTLDRLATVSACFWLGEIAGMIVVRMAKRDIVTDGIMPAWSTFLGITGTGMSELANDIGSHICDGTPVYAWFPFRCSPCTVFCQ